MCVSESFDNIDSINILENFDVFLSEIITQKPPKYNGKSLNTRESVTVYTNNSLHNSIDNAGRICTLWSDN